MAVKWIKIVGDPFDKGKLELIEQVKGGDALTAIWLRLLCVATKSQKDGTYKLVSEIPFSEKMLSDFFGRSIQKIKMALKVLEALKLIKITEDATEVDCWMAYREKNMDEVEELQHLRSRIQDSIDPRKEKHKYGKYSNVLLSGIEIDKLKKDYPKLYEKKIDDLSIYMKSKGVAYKDHYATVRNWLDKEVASIKSRNKSQKEDINDFYEMANQWAQKRM